MITSPSPHKMARSRSVTLRFRPPGASPRCSRRSPRLSRLDDPDVFDHPAAVAERPVFDDPAAIAEALAAHARKPRTVGVLLVRLGGYAAGVFTGYPPVLGAAKVGSRLVHGRSAAGGWSQHRFARRREKQANEALSAAADAAVMIFGGGAAVRSTARKEQQTAAPRPAARPQPGRPALTPLCSAGTAARSPTCATTPGWRPTSASPPSGS